VGDVLCFGTVDEARARATCAGVKNLFRYHPDNRRLSFSLDGDRIGRASVNRDRTASRYDGAIFKGRAGHAVGAFVLPTRSRHGTVDRAKISDFRTPSSPKTTFPRPAACAAARGGEQLHRRPTAPHGHLHALRRMDELLKLEKIILAHVWKRPRKRTGAGNYRREISVELS